MIYSRTWTWIAMIGGGTLFQAGKYLYGLPFDTETLFISGYWSAAALALNWYVNRVKTTTKP